MTKTDPNTNPLRFLPVILVSLAFIGLGLYKNFHQVFDIRQSLTRNYYNSDLSQTTSPIETATSAAKIFPTAADGGKKIIQAILNSKCQVEVTTDKKDYNITAEGLVGNCNNEQLGKISPSKEILAFTGTFGQSVSLLKLFILNYEKSVTLGSWKDGNIKDYIFLPDDTLIAMIDDQGKTSLDLYDISLITRDFSDVFNASTGYITPGKRHGSIYLPMTNGETLNYKDGKIQVLSQEKSVLIQIDPQSIMLETRLTIISPAKAMQMAMNYYKENESGPGQKAVFEPDGSTDASWQINIVTIGGAKVKQYMINNATGEFK